MAGEGARLVMLREVGVLNCLAMALLLARLVEEVLLLAELVKEDEDVLPEPEVRGAVGVLVWDHNEGKKRSRRQEGVVTQSLGFSELGLHHQRSST